MTDRQPTMPFGKHKGKEFDDVPADYLMWLYNKPNNNLRGPLKEYIDANLDSLQQEAADLEAAREAEKAAKG